MLHDTPPFPAITLTSYHYAAVMHWLKGQLPLYRGTAVKLLWEIADRTFGHRKWEDVISLSQFAACGMGRDTVLVIIAHLLEVGIISRRPVGNSYAYRINIPHDLFSERPGGTDRDDVWISLSLLSTASRKRSLFLLKIQRVLPKTETV
jgi:hypothetical protein